MIKACDIHKSFGNLEVLRGVSMEVASGEMVAIVGASGAGKTTLLQIMGTLLQPDKGSVHIAGVDVGSLDDKRLSLFRNRHIGFVFQFHHLLPEFTALENVMLPALIGGASRKEAECRAKELLDMVNLLPRASHKPSALSGGEQQRAAIARALINRPSVVLADEPTGNLDTKNRDEIYSLLGRVRSELGQTIVIVTHDERLVAQTDRKIVMSDGAIL
ncbi:MAG: ABC transporter ATP-binding protein [Alistipes sp.]